MTGQQYNKKLQLVNNSLHLIFLNAGHRLTLQSLTNQIAQKFRERLNILPTLAISNAPSCHFFKSIPH
jgi:hypothetical protein